MGQLQKQYPTIPTADSATNVTFADVVGNKTDTVSGDSLIAVNKQIVLDSFQ